MEAIRGESPVTGKSAGSMVFIRRNFTDGIKEFLEAGKKKADR